MLRQQERNISKNLTSPQKIAADYYVLRGNKSDAYRHAYATSRMKATTLNRNAHALF
jgi:uncharacterized membrane protein